MKQWYKDIYKMYRAVFRNEYNMYGMTKEQDMVLVSLADQLGIFCSTYEYRINSIRRKIFNNEKLSSIERNMLYIIQYYKILGSGKEESKLASYLRREHKILFGVC